MPMSKKTAIIVMLAFLAALFVYSNKIGEQPPQLTTEDPRDQAASHLRGEGLLVNEEMHMGSEEIRPGNSIKLDTVIPRAGFVVVRREENGQLGKYIGKSEYLEPGSHENVSITTSEEMKKGEVILVMLYADNGNKVFSLSEDYPILDPGGYLVLLRTKL